MKHSVSRCKTHNESARKYGHRRKTRDEIENKGEHDGASKHAADDKGPLKSSRYDGASSSDSCASIQKKNC